MLINDRAVCVATPNRPHPRVRGASPAPTAHAPEIRLLMREYILVSALRDGALDDGARCPRLGHFPQGEYFLQAVRAASFRLHFPLFGARAASLRNRSNARAPPEHQFLGRLPLRRSRSLGQGRQLCHHAHFVLQVRYIFKETLINLFYYLNNQ